MNVRKRYSAFLVSFAVLSAGYFFGKPDIFSEFSTAIVGLFGAYAIGQSATDWKQAEK